MLSLGGAMGHAWAPAVFLLLCVCLCLVGVRGKSTAIGGEEGKVQEGGVPLCVGVFGYYECVWFLSYQVGTFIDIHTFTCVYA